MRKVIFYSTKTCPNCRVMKNWVDTYKLPIEYITLDHNSPEVVKYDIQSVPTIIVFEDEAIVGRLSGSHSKASLEAFFKSTNVM